MSPSLALARSSCYSKMSVIKFRDTPSGGLGRKGEGKGEGKKQRDLTLIPMPNNP